VNDFNEPESDVERSLLEHLTEDEYVDLLATRNGREWDRACDRVKAARNGQYPYDWFSRMNRSGVMARHFATFPADSVLPPLAPSEPRRG
jgi:hypothetical protein